MIALSPCVSGGMPDSGMYRVSCSVQYEAEYPPEPTGVSPQFLVMDNLGLRNFIPTAVMSGFHALSKHRIAAW